MCNYCLEFYHPECINVYTPENVLTQTSTFKCPECVANQRTDLLYEEGNVLI